MTEVRSGRLEQFVILYVYMVNHIYCHNVYCKHASLEEIQQGLLQDVVTRYGVHSRIHVR